MIFYFQLFMIKFLYFYVHYFMEEHVWGTHGQGQWRGRGLSLGGGGWVGQGENNRGKWGQP